MLNRLTKTIIYLYNICGGFHKYYLTSDDDPDQ